VFMATTLGWIVDRFRPVCRVCITVLS